ncbi:hypothetical protein [Enterovibrio baiacu]|uniref:hypothetical protein n=1 Tax=Enterovibrio baiacu TaxID=2491023 RepID=UPI00101361AA|nr:hypothetical protein [Enterovibrio baiacu]MBE1275019.1 hypothetical protein [Enterovibrio baiacu]
MKFTVKVWRGFLFLCGLLVFVFTPFVIFERGLSIRELDWFELAFLLVSWIGLVRFSSKAKQRKHKFIEWVKLLVIPQGKLFFWVGVVATPLLIYFPSETEFIFYSPMVEMANYAAMLLVLFFSYRQLDNHIQQNSNQDFPKDKDNSKEGASS